MNYRLYHPDDFSQLYAIEEICFQPPFRFPRRYVRRLVDSPAVITWIAEEDSKVAGFSIADFDSDTKGIFAYIQTIEVLPDLRGQGIGDELLRRIEASASDRGAQAIWLHVESQNSGAIRLYESHAFKCEGRQENYYAQGRAALVYRKLLPNRS